MTANTTATPRGSELLPCPLCGDPAATTWHAGSNSEDWAGATCKFCGLTLDEQGPGCMDRAAELWNTRAAIKSAAAPGMGGVDALVNAADRLQRKAMLHKKLTSTVFTSDVERLRTALSALATHPTPTVAAIPAAAEGELYRHRAIQQLLYFTDHAVSASEEGVPYAIPRAWLDVLTAMGLMEKTGRNRWSVTDSAQTLLNAAALSPKPDAGAGVGDALTMFTRCAYPCDKSIDPRGYSWSEAYLDQALKIAQAAIDAVDGGAK